MSNNQGLEGNALSRLKAYVDNVGVRRGLGLVAHKWIGKILNSGAESVWGGLGEDALLWYYLTEVLSFRQKGFYVDVGCNDPVQHSNTYRLYQLGWRGIAIDADQDLVERYAKVRPRDVAVTALVSDVEKEMKFHVFEGTEGSTADEQSASTLSKTKKIKETRKLRSTTLTAILERFNCPEEFQLLKIDVEGYDEAVLRSVDLRRYRPRIVFIEIHNQTVESVVNTEVYKILAHQGYKMVSLAGYNGIFVRPQAF